MISRMTSDGKPIVSPLSDSINQHVVPDLPNPSSLFWRSLESLHRGNAIQQWHEQTVIVRRESAKKLERKARGKIEFLEELDYS